MLQGRWKIFRTKSTQLLEAGDPVACITLAQSFLAAIDKEALDSSARNYSESDTSLLLDLDPKDFPISKDNVLRTLDALQFPRGVMDDLNIISQVVDVIYTLITITIDEECLECGQGPLELSLNTRTNELLLECEECHSIQTLSGKPAPYPGEPIFSPTIAQIRRAGGSHLLPEGQ